MIDMPSFLCRLGLHKWRYEPEDAVIINREEHEGEQTADAYVKSRMLAYPIPTYTDKILKTPEAVFIRRECQRCGIKQKRKIYEDDQGNKTPISGWEKTKKQ
jgi:hypothetical protein